LGGKAGRRCSPSARTTFRAKPDGAVATNLPDNIPVTDREIDVLRALLGERISKVLSAS